ncbi:hypothetical protein QBC45DRAFT_327696, partial [Copromyces sp. CBS 386.78]
NENEYLKYYDFNRIKYLRNRFYNSKAFANDLRTPRLTTLINTQTPPSTTLIQF